MTFHAEKRIIKALFLQDSVGGQVRLYLSSQRPYCGVVELAAQMVVKLPMAVLYLGTVPC